MNSLLITESLGLGLYGTLSDVQKRELADRCPSFFAACRHPDAAFREAYSRMETAEEIIRKEAKELKITVSSGTESERRKTGTVSPKGPGSWADSFMNAELMAAVSKNPGIAAPAPDGEVRISALGREGFLPALWDLCEASGAGAELDSRYIPLRQETIEICEYLDIDPYLADSTGAMLIAAPDVWRLCYKLRSAGIPAAPVGILTKSRARTIRYAGHTRYLDKPRP